MIINENQDTKKEGESLGQEDDQKAKRFNSKEL